MSHDPLRMKMHDSANFSHPNSNDEAFETASNHLGSVLGQERELSGPNRCARFKAGAGHDADDEQNESISISVSRPGQALTERETGGGGCSNRSRHK